jgi:hypothetical protein
MSATHAMLMAALLRTALANERINLHSDDGIITTRTCKDPQYCGCVRDVAEFPPHSNTERCTRQQQRHEQFQQNQDEEADREERKQ